jgi:hypothetical protein
MINYEIKRRFNLTTYWMFYYVSIKDRKIMKKKTKSKYFSYGIVEWAVKTPVLHSL